jgi:hypothetical protein
MAGALTISTLNNDTGVLATQNGMTGIAKAWVRFSVSGTTVTVDGSFNISSVTRTGTGQYVFTFTVNMPNANYSVVPANGGINTAGSAYLAAEPFCIDTSPFYALPTASAFDVAYTQSNLSTRDDPLTTCVAVFSS